MKKIIALVTIVCLLFALGACAADTTTTQGSATTQPTSDDTVYKFNVSFAAPEFVSTSITASLDRIQEQSNGRIEFTYYYSWSLTSVPTVIDDLNSGVVDIAAVPISEHINLFPYSNLITYTPFLGLPGTAEAGEIFDEMCQEMETLSQEYTNAGVYYWTNYPMPGYNIYTTEDHAITTPDDLKGLKLITSSALMQEYVTANGGAAVSTPVTEYATSLNTNVVDGAITHINVMAAFGCLDFLNAGTVFGETGTAMSVMTMCFSSDKWNKLPEDLQQLFVDEADALRENQCDADLATQANALAALEEKGTVTYLTDDQIAVWADAFKVQREAYIAELISNGHADAQDVYDALMTKMAAYE